MKDSRCQDYPCPDKMLRDVVVNVQVGGICKHFSDLFQDGQGFFRSVLKFLLRFHC